MMKTLLVFAALLAFSGCGKAAVDVCKPKMDETISQFGAPDKVSTADDTVTYAYSVYDFAREFRANASTCEVSDKFTGDPLGDFPFP